MATMGIAERLKAGTVLCDGGYLIELERRGYVRSGSDQEKVGTGKGSGTYTPEVAIEHPAALRGLHEEFLKAGAQVLQALTFFATRGKLDRAGYGRETEAINRAAVRIAREVAGDAALVAGSVSRTQLMEREGPSAAPRIQDLLGEQIAFLKDAGVDFLILETFFHVSEMKIALAEARKSGLPIVATYSLRPKPDETTDGVSAAEACRIAVAEGAIAAGVNCEQEPARMLPVLRAIRGALPAGAFVAAQPAALRTSDAKPYFTGMPEFPDALETIQVARNAFTEFGRAARAADIRFVGGCCGANAAYIRALKRGISN
jgi:betaine-homocysteine S-methyltransferase